MKEVKDLKKGDTVVVYSDDKRNPNYEDTVTSIGRKYITVSERWMNKFNIETLYAKDWAAYKLFLGNMDEFNVFAEEQEECKELYCKIHARISQNLGKEKLTKIWDIINDNSTVQE